MEKYSSLINNDRVSGETNDCTVVATSLVTGLPYGLVHKAFADAGRKPRGGCNRSVQRIAWKSLGYEVAFSVGAKKFKIDSGISSLKKGRFLSAKQINEHYEEYFKYWPPFLVYCSGHVAAVVDGKLQDWTATKGNKRFYKIVFLEKVSGSE